MAAGSPSLLERSDPSTAAPQVVLAGPRTGRKPVPPDRPPAESFVVEWQQVQVL